MDKLQYFIEKAKSMENYNHDFKGCLLRTLYGQQDKDSFYWEQFVKDTGVSADEALYFYIGMFDAIHPKLDSWWSLPQEKRNNQVVIEALKFLQEKYEGLHDSKS